MEKINEKRLSVLKVALECLLVLQKRMEVNKAIFTKEDENSNCEAVKLLEPGELLIMHKDTLQDCVIYVISHLKKPFEETNLPEELEELKKKNIDFALDKILEGLEKIKKEEIIDTELFSDYSRILFHLERGMR